MNKILGPEPSGSFELLINIKFSNSLHGNVAFPYFEFNFMVFILFYFIYL